MALGIDIARYQTVTNWQAVKNHGVEFVWVKGTDGGGPAPIQRADGQVAGAKSVGIPVGLYHFAQLSPSPEVQADVLTAEVMRLNAVGLVPVLDLEEPHSPGTAAATFTRRFLGRLLANGFPRVGLYANTSMLAGIRADDIRREANGAVVIWAARYGANTGSMPPDGVGGYSGHVDVHQYTSAGSVPGIQASGVDLNESRNNLLFLGDEAGMEIGDKIRAWDGFEITVGQALFDNWQLVNNLNGRPTRPGKPADTTPWITAMERELAAIKATGVATLAEVTNDPDITLEQLGALVEAKLDARPVRVVIDEAAVDSLVEGLAEAGFTPGASPEEVRQTLVDVLTHTTLSGMLVPPPAVPAE